MNFSPSALASQYISPFTCGNNPPGLNRGRGTPGWNAVPLTFTSADITVPSGAT